MWKKGSYDVSSSRHQRFDHVNVVDNQQGHTTRRFDSVRKLCNRLKKFSEIRDKLVPLIVALFVIIFVLIGVIVWLSVSIYLININIHPTSDEIDHGSIKAESLENDKSTATTSNSVNDRSVLPFPPTQQQLLQTSNTTPENGAYHDACIELFRAAIELTRDGTVVEEPRRRSNRKLRNTPFSSESTTKWEQTPKVMTDEIKNIGCDCGIVLPQRVEEKIIEKQNVERLVESSADKNLNSEAAFITTKSLKTSSSIKEGEYISETVLEKEELTDESTLVSVNSDEDNSEETDGDQNSSIYFSHGNTIIKMYQSPLIIARCGPYIKMVSKSDFQ